MPQFAEMHLKEPAKKSDDPPEKQEKLKRKINKKIPKLPVPFSYFAVWPQKLQIIYWHFQVLYCGGKMTLHIFTKLSF